MSIFQSKITDRFFDENIKTSSKFGYAILLLFGIYLVNNITSFTYYLELNNKTKALKELSELKESSKDSMTISFCELKSKEVIESDNIINKSIGYLSKIALNKYKINTSDAINIKSDIVFKFLLYYGSSGGFYYLASIFLLFISFTSNDSSTLTQRISISALVFFIMFILGWILSTICSLIPIFNDGNYSINYLVNIFIQIGSIYLMNKIFGKT